ncbi:MAG TPA: hypothetical protein VJG83_04095 [archaeon]|nr:hypothetical protein [archaeon]
MQVIVKVKKIGGSFMARIPSDAVKELNLKENDSIHLEMKKPRKTYLGIYKGIGQFTEDDRFDKI